MASRSSVRRICLIGAFSALYAVFSVCLKFPLIGNTYLDLGYVVLTITCFLFAPVDCALIGGIGCTAVNLLFSPLGFSPSHLVCNLIIGFLLALVCRRYLAPRGRIPLALVFAAVWGILLLAIGVKAGMECLLYAIPVAVKLPKAVTAFLLDVVTISLSLPLALVIRRRLARYI